MKAKGPQITGLQLKPANPEQPLRVGVFMPTWLGDGCMATPALRALRGTFPGATLVGVARPPLYDLLQGGAATRHEKAIRTGQAESTDPPRLFDEYVLFQKSWSGRRQLRRDLSRAQLDVMLLFSNAFWTAAVSRLAGIKTLVGYDRDARGWLLTERVEVQWGKQPVRPGGKRRFASRRKPAPVPAVDYYLNLVRWIGGDTSDRSMSLPVTSDDQRLASEFWEKRGLRDASRVVVINSNAATGSARVWPEERVRELAERLATELHCHVILHAGPSEREAANRVAEQVGHSKVVSMGSEESLPVGLSKALLGRADLVITSDSGVRHMAVAMNRRVITLFGPTDPAWTTTYNQPEIYVEEKLPCRPCYQKKCPLKHHDCMRQITVDRVFQLAAGHFKKQVAA